MLHHTIKSLEQFSFMIMIFKKKKEKKSQNCQNVYLIKESFLCNWGSFITSVVGG